MNGIGAIVFLIEVSAFVAGEVLLKHAMQNSNRFGFRNPRVLGLLGAGTAAMTLSFFLTLALLQHFDLSVYSPLQASSILVVIGAAAVLLRERLTLQLVVGALIVTVGIALVSTS